MFDYTGQYLYPPRPEDAIPVQQLVVYQRKGYVAQVKKNGTNNVIKLCPDGSIECMTRHKTAHKAWQMPEKSIALLRALANGKYWVFSAELLHSKVTGIRDINYIHDILVADGEYLIGSTFMERRAILRRLLLHGGEQETHSHYVIDKYIHFAKVHRSGFLELFKSLTAKEDEGLVLKDTKAPLKFCIKPNSNKAMVKCRRPELSPNYTI